MLVDCVLKYYEEGYNCAESIIRGANDVYALGITDNDLRMTAAFGGGLQIGDICGALAACSCVISMRYVKKKAHDYEEMRTMTQKLVIAFQKKMGSRLCAKIKPVYHDSEKRCANTVALSAELLEEFIMEWDKHIKEER